MEKQIKPGPLRAINIEMALKNSGFLYKVHRYGADGKHIKVSFYI